VWGEVKHLCLVKFKEVVVVKDVLKGMADLAAQMDMVSQILRVVTLR
jgi:acyl carrier protein phosphodiesterase